PVRVIRGVQVATRCKARNGRTVPAPPTGAGRRIGRERSGPWHARPEIWRDRGEVVHRLIGQSGSAGQVVVNAIGTGLVGGEKTRRAVTVVHFPDIGGAGQNVIVRLVWIVAQLVTYPQFLIGRGHDLHQAHRSNRRGGLLLTPRFLPHDRTNPLFGHAVSCGGLADIRAPRIVGRSRWRVIARRGYPLPPVGADFDATAGAIPALLSARGEQEQRQ